jgi:hypothetical protein
MATRAPGILPRCTTDTQVDAAAKPFMSPCKCGKMPVVKYRFSENLMPELDLLNGPYLVLVCPALIRLGGHTEVYFATCQIR